MEQIIQNLTNLIGVITERFPDENDLKGFPGISRALVLESINECNGLVTTLKEHNNHFDVILLKRESAEVFEKLFRELDEDFGEIKRDKFNHILKLISKLRSIIRETYATVINTTPLRTEADIAKAKEELALLNANNEQLKKINQELVSLKEETHKNISALTNEVVEFRDSTSILKGEVEEMKKASTTIVVDFQEKQKVAIENEKTINDFIETIETKKTSIEEIQRNTNAWEQDIKMAKESLAIKVTEFNNLNDRSKAIQQQIEVTHEKIVGKENTDGSLAGGYLQDTEELINKASAFLYDQQTKFSTQFDEIKSLLPDATSAGLAAAYQQQKESYKKPIYLWSTVFFVTISIMILLGVFILWNHFEYSSDNSLNGALISLLKDLPFFIPTIWLAAFASKQQSQHKRLQQEYAFKETNAKSFHGHKEQIERLMKENGADKELLSQLVAQLVIITAQNPSNTLDSKSHEDSGPLIKFFEKYFPSSYKKKDKE